MRELHTIYEINSAHQNSPPEAQIPAPFRQLLASAKAVNRLSCLPFPLAREKASADAVGRAKPLPVENVRDLADVESVDLSTLPRIETRIPDIDRVIGGFYFGQVVLLSGRRGEGKSTFLSQMVLEARDQGYGCFVYSGELTDYNFRAWLDLQAAGAERVVTTRNPYGDAQYHVPEALKPALDDWYRGKVYLYDNNAIPNERGELETLTDTIEKSIRRYDLRAVFIDNLMTAMDIDTKDDLYQAQSEFLRRLKTIAIRYNVMILLVAHPRKTGRDVEDNDDVSGSADITNRVDTVLIYSRAKQDDEFDGKIVVTKNRLTGKLAKGDGAIRLMYSQSSKRITSAARGTVARRYGWETGTVEPAVYPPELPF